MKKTILETDRLILEVINESHLNDLFALLANEKVHRFFPKSLNEDESRDFYKEVRRRYDDDGFSFWAVIRRSDGKFIGICGLLKQIVDNREEIEVGYRFLDNFWGCGYGSEAARGCMDYARETLGTQSVISLIREINKPSIRVAEKNGMKHEKDTVFHDMVHGVYRKKLL